MTDPFDTPAESAFISWDDLENELLLITVKEKVFQKTKFDKEGKPTAAIKADVAVLTGDNKDMVYEDTLIFPAMLRSRLEPRIGRMVLATLVKETNDKIKEKWSKTSFQWNFKDPTEDDKILARKWIEGLTKAEDPFA